MIRRRWITKLGYGLYLFAFVEVALQTFYFATAGDFLFRRAALPIYAANAHSGVFNRPGLAYDHRTNEFEATYYTDGAGLRVPNADVRVARDKAEGAFRILLLGPSFAYGWGVNYEDSFVAQVEDRLESQGYRDGRDVEIVNAGVPSLPASPHLRWYEAVGRDYRPDLVVQFVYGSMAIGGDAEAGGSVTEDGYLVFSDLNLRYRVREQAKRVATVFYAWAVWARWSALSDDTNDRSVQGAGRELHLADAFDLSDPTVATSLDFYDRLRSVVEQDGASLLVVYFPLSYAVHAEDRTRWRHLGIRDIAAQASFDEAFGGHLRSRGFDVLDLSAVLRQAAEGGDRLYYWLDIHWTPRGNEVAADAVATHLTGKN